MGRGKAPHLQTPRDAFRASVFARDNNRCVVCGKEAHDAHHLIERRLWPDGGYFTDNGVSLCQEHHLQAERTLLSVEELRAHSGITKILTPPGFDRDEVVDKWGNQILPDGTRMRGPLFHEEGVQKALKEGGALDLFTPYVKHPRIKHLPWSEKRGEDDLGLTDLSAFHGREVVVTAKLDGENTTFYGDGHTHARSLSSGYHPGRTWAKSIGASVGSELPEGWRVCAENMQALHTLAYKDLPGYLMVFSIWNEANVCLSWDDTEEWCKLLNLPTVPVLWRGEFSEEAVKACADLPQPYEESGTGEGYVLRAASSFTYQEFPRVVAKFVRDSFQIAHGKHWSHRELVENQLG